MSAAIPRGLQAVVLRCLEKDRRARFSTIAELVAALAPFARNQREAVTIAERTNLMLQRPSRPGDLAPPLAHDSISTTLSGSAASGLRPRHRRAIHGSIWLLGAVAALSGAGLAIFARVHAPVAPAGSNTEPQEISPSSASTAPPDARTTERTANAGRDTLETASDAGAATADAAVNTSAVTPVSDAGVKPAAPVPDRGEPNAPSWTGVSQIVPHPPSTAGRPREPAPHSQNSDDTVDVAVDSVPSGAQVLLDGAVLGTTPYYGTLPRGDREDRLVLRLAGYADKLVVARASQPIAEHVTLVRKASTPAPPSKSPKGARDRSVNPF